MMTNSETKHAIRMILISASLAGMSYISFHNGLLLAYFSHLKVPSATILILLSILPVSLFFFIIPFSYLSDKLGRNALMYACANGFFDLVSIFLKDFRMDITKRDFENKTAVDIARIHERKVNQKKGNFRRRFF